MSRRGDIVVIEIPYYDRSGLAAPSAVKCENVHTVSQARIKKTLGHLSDALKQKLDDCLNIPAAATHRSGAI